MTDPTRLEWATELAGRFTSSRPPPAQTVAAVVAWTLAEGGAGPQWNTPGNLAARNPLNNTQAIPGSWPTPGNTPPVQGYATWEDGLTATERVIRQPNMAGIAHELELGCDCEELAAAVAASPWGTGDFSHLCTPPSSSSANPEEQLGMIARDPKTGGYWVADVTGAVFAFAGAPYLGGLNRHPEWNAGAGNGTAEFGPCVGIAADGEGGYVLACHAPGEVPALYHLTVDGTYR